VAYGGGVGKGAGLRKHPHHASWVELQGLCAARLLQLAARTTQRQPILQRLAAAQLAACGAAGRPTNKIAQGWPKS
jgi:hypothetical protein